MKKDITTSEDVSKLVHLFYDQVMDDEVIGHFFTSVAQVNWEQHLPHMIQFWESILLGKATFNGFPMRVHLMLNKKEALLPHHFNRWLDRWNTILDTHFEGTNTQEAKKRARIMRDLILFKIDQQKNHDHEEE